MIKSKFTLTIEFEHCGLGQKEVVENLTKHMLDIDYDDCFRTDVCFDVRCDVCNTIVTLSL